MNKQLRAITATLRAVRLTVLAGRKRNDRLFLHRLYRCVVAVLVAFAAVQVARADIPPAYPPQNTPIIRNIAQAPTGQTFRLSNGTLIPSIEDLKRNPRVIFDGSTANQARRTHPIRLTNNYGAVATGTIQTQTAMPGTSTVAKLGAAYYATQAAGAAIKHGAPSIGRDIANGDYKSAMLDAGEALLQGLKAAGDSASFGAIGGFESGYQAYKDAQQAKAQQAIENHRQQEFKYEEFKNLPQVYVVYRGSQNGQTLPYPGYGIIGVYKEAVGLSNGRILSTNFYPDGKGGYVAKEFGTYPFEVNGVRVAHYVYQATPTPELFAPPLQPEDFLLNSAEIQTIMVKQLEQLLNDNNRNHTELMNALWNAGVLNPSNTQTMISGSPADNTFVSAPFTPAGTDQAQQTQYIVQKDGTVIQNTILRPDLAANTSQAPTREQIGGNQQQQQQESRPPKEGSSAEKPDICAQNPNSLMCAPLGSADYADPVIPEKQENLEFEPANFFHSDGVCPQPATFVLFDKTYTFDYTKMCGFFRKIRPLIVLAGMVSAMFMTFSAVKEL